MLIHTLRLVSTVGLLVVVWRNVHWSVALCCSLAALSTECFAYVVSNLRRRVEALEQPPVVTKYVVDERIATDAARGWRKLGSVLRMPPRSA